MAGGEEDKTPSTPPIEGESDEEKRRRHAAKAAAAAQPDNSQLGVSVEQEGEMKSPKDAKDQKSEPTFYKTVFPTGINPLRSAGQPRSLGERKASPLMQGIAGTPWWGVLGVIGFGMVVVGAGLLPFRMLSFISKGLTWLAMGKDKPAELTWRTSWDACKKAFSNMRDTNQSRSARVGNFFKGVLWGLGTFFMRAGDVARGIFYTGVVLMNGQGDIQDKFAPGIEQRLANGDACKYFPYLKDERDVIEGAHIDLNGSTILSDTAAQDRTRQALDFHVRYLRDKYNYLDKQDWEKIKAENPDDPKVIPADQCKLKLDQAARLLDSTNPKYALGSETKYETRIQNISLLEKYLDDVAYGREDALIPDSSRQNDNSLGLKKVETEKLEPKTASVTMSATPGASPESVINAGRAAASSSVSLSSSPMPPSGPADGKPAGAGAIVVPVPPNAAVSPTQAAGTPPSSSASPSATPDPSKPNTAPK